jgi:hypothetical protein
MARTTFYLELAPHYATSWQARPSRLRLIRAMFRRPDAPQYPEAVIVPLTIDIPDEVFNRSRTCPRVVVEVDPSQLLQPSAVVEVGEA